MRLTDEDGKKLSVQEGRALVRPSSGGYWISYDLADVTGVELSPEGLTIRFNGGRDEAFTLDLAYDQATALRAALTGSMPLPQ